MAADRIYKRLDYDQIDYMIYYLFTKLKNSPLTSNTTYILQKDGEYIQLVDNFGTVAASVHDDNTTYTNANSSYDGLMPHEAYAKLAGVEAGAEENVIASITVNGTAATITNKDVSLTIPTSSDIETIAQGLGYVTAADVNAAIAAAISSAYTYKGSVTDYTDLPQSGNQNGDTYTVENSFILDGTTYPPGTDVTWNGTSWSVRGGTGTVRQITAGTGLTGGTITETGTIALDTSGATAGTYGPSANTTGSDGTTVNIPEVTVDAYGRVTSISNKVLTCVDTDTVPTILTSALAANATTLSFTNAAIGNNTIIFVTSDDDSVVPESKVQSSTTLTLTFSSTHNACNIKVMLFN